MHGQLQLLEELDIFEIKLLSNKYSDHVTYVCIKPDGLTADPHIAVLNLLLHCSYMLFIMYVYPKSNM